MTITQDQLTQLTRIYNTLLEVHTKGESSFLMTDSLRALEQVVTQIAKAAEEEQKRASEVVKKEA